MKPLFFILILFMSGNINAQEKNILTGRTNVSLLKSSKEYDWFKENYESYNPGKAAIKKLKKFPKDVTVLIFAGTWCSDTRKLLPEFYKVADMAGIPSDNITLYFLDKGKASPEGAEKNYNITLVPTFIFVKNGHELGRIIESVEMQLEEVIKDIVEGVYYNHTVLPEAKPNLYK